MGAGAVNKEKFKKTMRRLKEDNKVCKEMVEEMLMATGKAFTRNEIAFLEESFRLAKKNPDRFLKPYEKKHIELTYKRRM